MQCVEKLLSLSERQEEVLTGRTSLLDHNRHDKEKGFHFTGGTLYFYWNITSKSKSRKKNKQVEKRENLPFITRNSQGLLHINQKAETKHKMWRR